MYIMCTLHSCACARSWGVMLCQNTPPPAMLGQRKCSVLELEHRVLTPVKQSRLCVGGHIWGDNADGLVWVHPERLPVATNYVWLWEWWTSRNTWRCKSYELIQPAILITMSYTCIEWVWRENSFKLMTKDWLHCNYSFIDLKITVTGMCFKPSIFP